MKWGLVVGSGGITPEADSILFRIETYHVPNSTSAGQLITTGVWGAEVSKIWGTIWQVWG